MTGPRGSSKRSPGKNSINSTARIGQFARRVRNAKERILRRRGIRRVTIRRRDRRERSAGGNGPNRSGKHTSENPAPNHLLCPLLLLKKKNRTLHRQEATTHSSTID